ncbi:ankyrin repeat domain-containing protein 50 [Coprinopsis cinerea okayama7|uniref:Ankyrin repeat domain-containing protein 50 n=1 Tax=Coprinopsis cinerea (strain Okayama-7 / 130 / ATCC MYA-4618 / FGSC 9003) TaxID=240176 RepID=A8P571_COPC7|nr:ankyrin repeat domain-containing protein 50 [Coprinopsis cinerea okayama7\|eukprot:XP_001838888.2 ankyrin repeat domain-containing protein 50 [Coprinopsis cinerea okayama7\
MLSTAALDETITNCDDGPSPSEGRAAASSASASRALNPAHTADEAMGRPTLLSDVDRHSPPVSVSVVDDMEDSTGSSAEVTRSSNVASGGILNNSDHVTISGGNFVNVGRDTVNNTTNIYNSSAEPPPGDECSKWASQAAEWLAPHVNFRVIHNSIQKQSTPGTGCGFIESYLVSAWFRGETSVIWGTGLAGAGKSVLASKLVDRLEQDVDETRDISVIFAYLRYTEPLSVEDVLEGLIKLHLQEHPFLGGIVKPLHSHHVNRGTRPSQQELIDVLRTIEKEFRVNYIVLDGVDEINPDTQFDLIETINSLQSKVSADGEDMALMVSDNVKRNPSLRSLVKRHGIEEELLSQILEKADGMFLHAKLQVEAIQDCLSVQTLRETLERIPPGLDGIYADTLARIEKRPEHALFAKEVLLWLLYCKRPLSVEEVRYAVANLPESYIFDEGRLIDEADLISICCGLIHIQENGWGPTVVRLIHYTAYDSLKRLLYKDFPDPHGVLTRICIQRLVAFDLTNLPGPSSTMGQNLASCINNHPFLRYAHVHWASHARESQSHQMWTAIIEFIRQCSSFPCGYRPGGFNTHILLLQPLHVVAAYNLPALVPAIAGHGEINAITEVELVIDEEGRDGPRWTPLIIASMNGYEKVVMNLLREKGIAVNTRGSDGRTALLWALANRHESVADLLLAHESIDVHRADNEGWTPLMMASRNGYTSLVDRLVQMEGIEVNAQNKDGKTALLLASAHGHPSTVSRLLEEERVDVHLRDSNGSSALVLAAILGEWERFFSESEKILAAFYTTFPFVRHVHGFYGLELFLLMGYEQSASGESNQAAYEAVVARLLQTPGTHVSYQDPGFTVLMSAACAGDCVPIIDQLLAADGTRLNAQSPQDGCTALMLASRRNHVKAVDRLLRQPGIDVNLQNKRGESALMLAVQEGHSKVVDRLLRAEGLDSSLRDNRGWTLLMAACYRGKTEIFDRLLQLNPVEAHARSKDGQTTLMIAAGAWRSEIVQRLLRIEGTQVNLRDENGFTALMHACYHPVHFELKYMGCKPVQTVSLLLATKGIEVNAVSADGDTALLLAARHRNNGTVKQLLQVDDI